MKQNKAPLFDNLLSYSKKDITSFDVPGHKQGLYKNRLNALFGENIRLDVNSMPELDLLSQPQSIIKEAQELMADVYNFDNSFFLVNGTSVGILAMIYSSVKRNEYIAVPRNSHKSVINAIILSGAIPVFIEPLFDKDWMIMNQISLDDIKKIHNEYPQIKALLIINPTYFGVCSDFDNIINYCQANNIISLVDQAHGAHFNFLDGYEFNSKPDLVAMSTHKTLGSLSQSSILLHNEGKVSHEHILKCLNMLQSTSASYLLMASLDETRYDVVNNKLDLFLSVKQLVSKYRKLINELDGITVMDEDYSNLKIDPFKLCIKVNNLNLSGFDVYKILKKEYNIQMELAETYCILAIISIADNEETLSNLYEALKDISKRYYNGNTFHVEFKTHSALKQKMNPYDAFNSEKEKVLINDSLNRVSSNTIMIYPPGIAICMPGEVIDEDVIQSILFYKKNTLFTISESDDELIEVVKEKNEF